MTAATRERKLKFINSFGPEALAERLVWALYNEGPDFLTDDQINRLTEHQAADAMATMRHTVRERNRTNRARMAALGEVA